MSIITSDWKSIDEVAQETGIRRTTLDSWARGGIVHAGERIVLPSFRLGRRIKIKTSDVEEFIRKTNTPAPVQKDHPVPQLAPALPTPQLTNLPIEHELWYAAGYAATYLKGLSLRTEVTVVLFDHRPADDEIRSAGRAAVAGRWDQKTSGSITQWQITQDRCCYLEILKLMKKG